MKQGLKKLKEVVKDLTRDDLIRQLYYALNAEKQIPWQKYDPENPPEFEKTFLVTNGRRVFPALLALEKRYGLQWWQEEEDYLITNVTHYAPINLPGEE